MELREKIAQADHIYFVCSGNIIRSAFCELYARHLGMDNVSSFATTYFSQNIFIMARDALLDLGVSPELINEFEPTHISEISSFIPNSLYFVMTYEHKELVEKEGISPEQVYLIEQVAGREKEVKDPYFNGGYDETFSNLKSLVELIIRLR